MAVAGLVMGIIGFVLCFIPCFGWFFALVLGILGAIFSGVGLAAVSETGEGRGMAISGLVLSILAVLFVPLWWFLVIGTLATAASNLQPAPPPIQRGGFPFPNRPGR